MFLAACRKTLYMVQTRYVIILCFNYRCTGADIFAPAESNI